MLTLKGRLRLKPRLSSSRPPW